MSCNTLTLPPFTFLSFQLSSTVLIMYIVSNTFKLIYMHLQEYRSKHIIYIKVKIRVKLDSLYISSWLPGIFVDVTRNSRLRRYFSSVGIKKSQWNPWTRCQTFVRPVKGTRKSRGRSGKQLFDKKDVQIL